MLNFQVNMDEKSLKVLWIESEPLLSLHVNRSISMTTKQTSSADEDDKVESFRKATKWILSRDCCVKLLFSWSNKSFEAYIKIDTSKKY